MVYKGKSSRTQRYSSLPWCWVKETHFCRVVQVDVRGFVQPAGIPMARVETYASPRGAETAASSSSHSRPGGGDAATVMSLGKAQPGAEVKYFII